MRRVAIGVAVVAVVWVAFVALAQPGNPNQPFGSTAGEKQRAVEYDKDGDRRAVNWKAIATGTGTPGGTPTPAPAGRCQVVCTGGNLLRSVGGSWEPVAAGGSNGCACAGTGVASTQVGTNNATASGIDSAAIGSGASATTTGAQAFGQLAAASGAGCLAIGLAATCVDTGAIAIGAAARADQPDCIAFGRGADCTDPNQLIIGGQFHEIVAVEPFSALTQLGTPTRPFNHLQVDEAKINGVTGTGKVVCVKANGDLGQCSDAPNGSGVCTCS